jgi:uncharacterized protein YecT (DUF1311 family)
MLRPMLFLLTCVSATALACDETESGLQDTYQSVWIRSDYYGRALLERAQAAWIEYREASCDSFSVRDGEISLEARAQCLSFMARERTAELQLMTYFVQEDDDRGYDAP